MEAKREITNHITNPPNDRIKLEVMDEPGAGGACHVYHATIETPEGPLVYGFNFQNGPIAEAGVNGLTHEVFLAIVIDRLRSFQQGPFACHENGAALSYCEAALNELQARTRARMARGVEGTNVA